jgi:hypothetical protein
VLRVREISINYVQMCCLHVFTYKSYVPQVEMQSNLSPRVFGGCSGSHGLQSPAIRDNHWYNMLNAYVLVDVCVSICIVSLNDLSNTATHTIPATPL